MFDAVAEFVTEWILPPMMIAFIVILFLLLFVAVPMWVYQECISETFSLKKAEWVCSKSHVEESTTYIKTGSVMVPHKSTSTVCDQWSRK